MPLRRFQRPYEQLSQFERGRIIGMMKAGGSARQVVRQLGRSDCVVRRCWDQWIGEMTLTQKPSSRHPRQTSCQEDCYIVRNASVQRTASSAANQAQVAPSLPVSSRTIRMCLAEGHLGSQCHYVCCLDTHQSTPPFGVVPSTRKLDCTGMEPGRLFPGSISSGMTIMFVCGHPVVNASIRTLLYSNTPLPQLV
ncbi:HTH_Tnp_Tc3_2 domain-containing protein [Trichonephila clavipes]|nr:HTH_Tnp_Tc3_2 domain-containing protein [Trichonephila clavipes]